MLVTKFNWCKIDQTLNLDQVYALSINQQHSLEVADEGAGAAMQKFIAEIVMIRKDLAKLKESHASIIYRSSK